MKKKSLKKQLFYLSLVGLPFIQFLLFYCFVNFKSILFAFQSYDVVEGFAFNGFENFKQIFIDLTGKNTMKYSLQNSIVLYLWTLLFGTGGAILFSNYIYKKFFGSKLFQIFLFLPNIISGVVMVTVYKFILDQGIPLLWREIFGVQLEPLLSQKSLKFGLVLGFSLFMGFGTNVLMYTSTMSGISPSVVESAELDGITPFKELIYITLPMIFPTFVTFITVGVATIFTNQMSLYTFYGADVPSDMYTFGYLLYKEVKQATDIMDYETFTYMSALGILLPIIAVPLTLGIKKFLEKFGPSAD